MGECRAGLFLFCHRSAGTRLPVLSYSHAGQGPFWGLRLAGRSKVIELPTLRCSPTPPPGARVDALPSAGGWVLQASGVALEPVPRRGLTLHLSLQENIVGSLVTYLRGSVSWGLSPCGVGGVTKGMSVVIPWGIGT